MASALKYFTLPKSKVTIWEKPLKAGGVFYYLYLDQTQLVSKDAEDLSEIIRTTFPSSSVKLKKTTKTYQISYSLPNGEKAQGVDEAMLEFFDDKLASFGYDDTKNQAVGTRGKKMIGTYATQGQSTITVTKPASPDYEVGDSFYSSSDSEKTLYEIVSIDKNVRFKIYGGSILERTKENFDKKINDGIWVIEKKKVSQPEVKEGQYYIDYINNGTLINVTNIQTNVKPEEVYFTRNGVNRYVDTLEEFQKLISNGKYVLYVPSGGDEWKMFTSLSNSFMGYVRILSTSSNEVVLASYDKNGNYENTYTSEIIKFCDELVEKGFVFSQKGGQATQPQTTQTTQTWVSGDLIVTFEGLPRVIVTYSDKFVVSSYYDKGQKKDVSVGIDDFNNLLKEGSLSVYLPSIGDVWDSTIYTTEIFDIQGNILSLKITNKETNYTFKTSTARNEFTQRVISDANYRLVSKGGQSTQSTSKPEIKKGQYYIDTTNNNKLLRVDDVTKPWVGLTESEDDFSNSISFDAFNERISEGRYKLYVPNVGDLWKRYDDDGELIGTNKIVSVSENVVFEVKFELREYTLDFSLSQFLENLRKSGYRNVIANFNLEPRTEYEKEVKQFEEKKDPQYSEKNKLKKELKDLVELKDLISDIDFEDKVNVSTLIIKTQNKINDIIAKEVEQRIGETKIFDELFEQSFTPISSRYDENMEKNDLVELVAPNGEISDLNEGVTNLVNSELFTEWFGDFKTAYFYRNLPEFGGIRVSKVLSEKFEPLVVWHGTGKQFSYFRFDNFPAAYFAVNRKYSDFFAKVHAEDGVGYVLPFFIKINNPLDLSFFKNEKVASKDFFDWMYLKTGMTPEQLEINPLMLDASMPPIPIWVYLRNNPTMLKKLADMGVYDGIKFYEFNPNVDPSDEAYETLAYITFDPHQSKLADPERGQILLASLKSFMLKKGGKV